MNKNIVYKIYESAGKVPVDDWRRLSTGKAVTLSYEFWNVVEKSNFSNIDDYRYIMFYKAGKAVAFIPSYIVRTDIAIFSKGIIRGLFGRIRKIAPNFMTLKMLECGSPVTINSPFFLIDPDLQIDEFSKALKKCLLRLALRNFCLMIIVRDFEKKGNYDTYKKAFKNNGFVWGIIIPNTFIDIKWHSREDYYQSMRSHYRYRLRKHIKISEKKNITYKIVGNFANLADELCQQWFVVHNNAKELVREVLTVEFYKEIALLPDSKVILYYENDKCIAHVLLLRDNDTLRWMYVGKGNSNCNSLYFFIIDKVVETGIKMCVKNIETGLTTYSIKQDFGAKIVPVRMGMSFVFPVFNFFVSFIYNIFNKPLILTKKRVFKEEMPESVK